ncbi:MAG: shikimate kinase [Bdellovibrionia bacterium]
MSKAAVIGKPIGHSLSPAIFTFLSHEQNFQYSSQEVDATELPQFIQNFRNDSEMVGLNVTIPHKELVIDHLDELSPEVRVTGASNVIHKSQGKLTGYNTDICGILMTLKNHHKGSLSGKRAWVLGAGGAARAVLYALGELKLGQVDVVNRTAERSLKLVKQMKQFFPSTEWRAVSGSDETGKDASIYFEPGDSFSLIINATPLGMSADLLKRDAFYSIPLFIRVFTAMETSKISDEETSAEQKKTGFRIEKGAVAFDLIYRPENTPFLNIAKQYGLIPVGGLEMLVEQALAAWKIWFGPVPNMDAQKTPLLNFLRNRPIFLTGFMGAGKSTVGKILSQRLSRDFLDLDRVIEAKENKTIGQIFEEKGEAVFREIEFKEFKKYFLSPNTVLALGGGTLLNPQIRSLILKVGTLIYLRTKPETIAKRIKSQNQVRPLLTSLGDLEQEAKIETLLKERESFYLQAQVQVDTDTLTPEEISDQISERLVY